MKIKRIFLSIILAGIIVFLVSIISNTRITKLEMDESKKQIVVSNFASYDFARAIIGDSENMQLTFLLGPGKEAHSYEPTSQDLIKIQNADLFVYLGGEIEPWSEKVIETIDQTEMKVICISQYVDVIEEKPIDGAEVEHEHEEEAHITTEEQGEKNTVHQITVFDQHIWTSPTNAIKMVQSLEKVLADLDEENAEMYKQNAENYIAQIEDVKQEIQELVDNRVRNRLVFGDKMPMQYFIEEYGLEVSAAFNGCSTETDPSISTIAYLVNKVKEENIPVVLYCELGTGKVAKTIAEDAGNGSTAMQIQTLHNIRKVDFDNGETWVSLMTKNIEVLKIALGEKGES